MIGAVVAGGAVVRKYYARETLSFCMSRKSSHSPQ